MAQIFHTGREEYASQPNLGFNPSESVRQVGQDLVNLEEYKQLLYMKREQEFLALMDVKTDNLIFEQYQTIAADEIDKFVKEATNSYKSKNGILSTQDKMELMKKRQQMEMKVDGMRAKAKQFLDNKELYAQKRELFDIDETNSLFGEFMKDPVNKPVPNPVPKYYDPVYLVRKLADATYKYGEITERPVYVEGTGWTKEAYRPRVGIEDEAKARQVLKEWYENDYEFRRSSMKKYGDNFEALWNDTKDILLPYRFEKTGTRGGGLNIGFTKGGVDFTITNDGRTFGVTGTPKSMTWGDEKVIFEGITDNKVRLRPARLEQEPDYELTKEMGFEGGADTQDKLSLDIYGGIYKVGGTIQVNGKWYYKKRGEVREVELNDNVIRDLKESLKGYPTFAPKFNEWLSKNKSNKPVSKPNNKSVKMNYLEWKKQNPNGTPADYKKYVNGR